MLADAVAHGRLGVRRGAPAMARPRPHGVCRCDVVASARLWCRWLETSAVRALRVLRALCMLGVVGRALVTVMLCTSMASAAAVPAAEGRCGGSAACGHAVSNKPPPWRTFPLP